MFAVFTHFSYMASNYKLMVTDLQGIDFLLSDPCINTNGDDTFRINEATD